MSHHIEVYVHVRGKFLRCVTVTITDAAQIGQAVRMIQISERFSEPRATFIVMVDGEYRTEGEY